VSCEEELTSVDLSRCVTNHPTCCKFRSDKTAGAVQTNQLHANQMLLMYTWEELDVEDAQGWWLL